LELIKSSEGGKTIGLEGAWGSGKSTVIKILESKLSNPEYHNDFHLYKFDAWTHQGEPLRRAFLENLFDRVLDTTWFNSGHVGSDTKNKWKDFQKELSRKTKISTKTVSPELNLYGILLILSFIFFPIGTSILSSGIASGKINFVSWAIGSTIFLIPIFFFSITLIWVFFKNRKETDWKEKLQDIVAKFLQKGYNTDTTRISETVEPSTIEFQANFGEFLNDALSAPTKRLVVVVDNLDRVSEKEVDSIWPVIRSFVDNSEFSSKDWFRRLWVVIPFAPTSLRPAGDKELQNSTDGKASNLRIAGFLDKVVQINFSVPAPILSNLRKFIEINLRLAFGDDLNHECLHKIFMVFSNEFEDQSKITPRIVISTINNMVATKLQWEDISLVSHAYFAVLRRDYSVEQISSKLSSGSLKSEKYEGIFPETIALDLAVLSCNVKVEIAAQKLYGDELELALTHPTGAQRLISDYSKIGYPEVLATLLAKNLAGSIHEPELLTKKLANLVELDSSRMSKAHRAHMLQDILGAMRKMPWLPAGSERFVTIVEYLAENDKSYFFREELASVLNRTKAVLESNIGPWYNPATSKPVAIVENWVHLRNNRMVVEYLLDKFSFYVLQVPGPFEEWLRICSELDNEDKLVSGFPPKIPITDIHREFRTTNYWSKPVHGLISGFNALEVNDLYITDDLIEQGFISRISRQAELPLNEAFITLPFIYKHAANNNYVREQLLKINNDFVLYYFATIFIEKPRRNREIDLPIFSPEKKMDRSRIPTIANLLFLWVLLGMKEVNYIEGYQAQGMELIRSLISSNDEEQEIITEMRGLFSLSPIWQEIILQRNMSRFAGCSPKALSFIQKFH